MFKTFLDLYDGLRQHKGYPIPTGDGLRQHKGYPIPTSYNFMNIRLRYST